MWPALPAVDRGAPASVMLLISGLQGLCALPVSRAFSTGAFAPNTRGLLEAHEQMPEDCTGRTCLGALLSVTPPFTQRGHVSTLPACAGRFRALRSSQNLLVQRARRSACSELPKPSMRSCPEACQKRRFGPGDNDMFRRPCFNHCQA